MYLKHWIMKYGLMSGALREEVAMLTDWLSNDRPPWASYRALMSGRLVAIDKNPGIRPIGVGETWQRLITKVNLKVTGEGAVLSCGDKQLCAGLPAGIEGAVHGARSTGVVEEYGGRGKWRGR